MPWQIELTTHNDDPYITVVSLLADIYDCLKRPIDRDIYEDLSPVYMTKVDDAFRLRCIRIPDEEASREAFEKGIKRVDFLCDKVWFQGLVQVKSMYHTFEIQLTSKP